MRSHTHEKIGRNDPCPCGSGKKYKQCCLNSDSTVPSSEIADTPWNRQREASDRLTADLLHMLERDFSPDMLVDAWSDFNQDDAPVPLSEMSHEISIFSPYLIFEWNPERTPRRSTGKPRGGRVLQAYLKKAANRLSPLEQLILEQAITRPVSFYEIVGVNPGRGAVLRDIYKRRSKNRPRSAVQTA